MNQLAQNFNPFTYILSKMISCLIRKTVHNFILFVIKQNEHNCSSRWDVNCENLFAKDFLNLQSKLVTLLIRRISASETTAKNSKIYDTRWFRIKSPAVTTSFSRGGPLMCLAGPSFSDNPALGGHCSKVLKNLLFRKSLGNM